MEVEKRRRQTTGHKGKRICGTEGVANSSVLLKCKVHGVGGGGGQEVTLVMLEEPKSGITLHFC